MITVGLTSWTSGDMLPPFWNTRIKRIYGLNEDVVNRINLKSYASLKGWTYEIMIDYIDDIILPHANK